MRSSKPLPLLLLMGCASGPRISTRVEPDTSFRYRTFAVTSAGSLLSGYHPLMLSPEGDAGLDRAAAVVLEQKGYRPAAADVADLIVDVGIGERGGGRELSADVDATGSQVGATDPEGPFNYVERALVLEAVDARTHRRVWQGTAQEPRLDRERLQETVRTVMASFPAAATR